MAALAGGDGGERAVAMQAFVDHFSELHRDPERLGVAARAVFEIMDVDGDGEISASDLQMHILKFGDTFVSDHEAALMLNALRSDGPVEFGAFEKSCVA